MKLLVSVLLASLLYTTLPCSSANQNCGLLAMETSSFDDPGYDSSEKEPAEDCEESVSATTVLKGITGSFYFQYPGQTVWLRYLSIKTEYISLNYSGPSASLTQYYSYDHQSTSYLTTVSNITTAIDCFLVSINREYYFKFTSSGAGGAMWSVCIDSLDETPEDVSTYVLHQEYDSTSSQGYHYTIEDYASINSTSSTPTSATFVNHDTTTYFDGIDDDHYCYDGAKLIENGPLLDGWSDGRRAVIDTEVAEYSSIAYSHEVVEHRPLDTSGNRLSLPNVGYRSSGTFISQTAVLTCAHSFYADADPDEDLGYLADGGMPKYKTFAPGLNSYGCSSGYYYPYGNYAVTDAYVSVSYLVSLCSFNKYKLPCANYDWALCETVPESGASLPTHSTMGLAAFSLPNGSFSYASFAGYGALRYTMDEHSYDRLLWTAPTNNTVSIMTDGGNGQFLGSTAITSSGGHSGCPLYYYNVTIENGQPAYHCQVLGITSGLQTFSPTNNNTIIYYHCASFFQMNSFVVNFAKEVVL